MSRLTSGLAALSLLVVCAAGPALAGGGPLEPATLLGSTGNRSLELITIDTGTGAGAFQANVGGFGPITSMAFTSDGALFAGTGLSTPSLVLIDPETGDETLIGTFSDGPVTGMAFIDNQLYGVQALTSPTASGTEGIPANLVTVDLGNASTTVVATLTDVFQPRGLAYDSTSRNLYATGFFDSGDVTGDSEQLLLIDPSNGDVTVIGSTNQFVGIGGLAFGPDGQLYAGGTNSRDAGTGAGAPLWTIDLGTGNATEVGDTGFGGIAALAFVPGGIFAPQEIPTLSWVGLLALLALLGGAGFLVLRRA